MKLLGGILMLAGMALFYLAVTGEQRTPVAWAQWIGGGGVYLLGIAAWSRGPRKYPWRRHTHTWH